MSSELNFQSLYFSDFKQCVSKFNKKENDSSSSSSVISARAMQMYVDNLKDEQFQSSTRRMYYNVWKNFSQFFIRLDVKPKSWLVLYVGFLVEDNKKSSMIASYISVIKSVLKADGVMLNENRYLLNALTRACRLKNDKVKIRLPIQNGLLALLLEKLREHFDTQPYLANMYQALFSAAYYGLLRVGEVTSSQHVIKASDVHVGRNIRNLMFVLRSSKTHSTSDHPQIIKVSHQQAVPQSSFAYSYPNVNINHNCPFKIIRTCAEIRRSFKSKEEQFFVFSNKDPVTAAHARNILKLMLIENGLDSSLYSFHSFRSGRAVDLLRFLDLDSVKKIGRWRSNAIFSYLKM